MAYEDDRVCPLHMPFLLLFFCAFSHNSIRQDMTFRKKSDDLF
nr:MAG TPA: hypothetical protein [Caudoviricetes sp.]